MQDEFVRAGSLMDLASYPQWLQPIVARCEQAKCEVVGHEVFQLMRSGALPQRAMRNFLVGTWPVIEQFPQYLAMNLLKVEYGSSPGHEMARKYLIRNIRVEQNHLEYWIEWAQAHGVGRDELFDGARSAAAEALSHWCWRTCQRDPLPVAMAATNYAIEGATGEWSASVCSSVAYQNGFPEHVRKRAMKWLRAHAQYDDTHPWEALEIISMLVGSRAMSREIRAIELHIRRSYEYMRMVLDDCLADEQVSSPGRVVPLLKTVNTGSAYAASRHD